MAFFAFAPYGAQGLVVRVEVDIRRGIPGVDMTGLPDGAVREARDRVRAAFRNSALAFPDDRVLINLAPAGVRKEGASLDLPIALAVLSAAGLAPPLPPLLALGELELSGRLRPVRGVLAAVAAALDAGARGVVVPRENGREAAVLAPGAVAAVSTLAEAVSALNAYAEAGRFPDSACPPPAPAPGPDPWTGDFADASGQVRYRRALELAAAGGHHLLAFGPPGAGKTLLARRFPSIVPALTAGESVEATRLHSLAGALAEGASLVSYPPFRTPHHGASAEGLLGGGRGIRPGEVSLAHLGALFLDEAPEFRADALRALREPVEDAVVTVVRAEGSVRLPADFQLLLAANPCPCGRLGKAGAVCLCSGDEVARHWRRLGGALLDRLELRVPVKGEGAASAGAGESSAAVARRVAAAVRLQRERYLGLPVRRNARLPPGLVSRFCVLDERAGRSFDKACEKLCFSARARHGSLKVARTIADLEASETIRSDHVLEAVQHRRWGDDPFDILADTEF